MLCHEGKAVSARWAKKLNVKFEVCSPGEFSICERENINMSDIVLSGVTRKNMI